jgi:hypothetical protein
VTRRDLAPDLSGRSVHRTGITGCTAVRGSFQHHPASFRARIGQKHERRSNREHGITLLSVNFRQISFPRSTEQ